MRVRSHPRVAKQTAGRSVPSISQRRGFALPSSGGPPLLGAVDPNGAVVVRWGSPDCRKPEFPGEPGETHNHENPPRIPRQGAREDHVRTKIDDGIPNPQESASPPTLRTPPEGADTMMVIPLLGVDAKLGRNRQRLALPRYQARHHRIQLGARTSATKRFSDSPPLIEGGGNHSLRWLHCGYRKS